MSHDVIFCLPPLPEDDREAWSQLDLFRAEGDEASRELRDRFERVAWKFPLLYDSPDDLISAGLWSDGPLRCLSGPRSMGHSMTDECARQFHSIVQYACATGLIVCDPGLCVFHRPNARQVLLKIEGSSTRPRALTPQIEEAIRRLAMPDGPGFLFLEGSLESAALAIGGQGTFEVAWREPAGEDAFRHFVAGRSTGAPSREVELQSNEFKFVVREDEALSSEHAVRILLAFAEGHPHPADYSWRDATGEFA